MVDQCRQRLLQAIVAVGAVDRILYGSDWPLEELRVAAGLIEGLDLPAGDRSKILGENARRLFRLPDTRTRGRSGRTDAPPRKAR
jgi:predicted TIM-barrel fold metal-dependent hydrolase